MSKEEAYGSRYFEGKLEDRVFLGNILLDSEYSISAARFRQLVKATKAQLSHGAAAEATFEIELASGLHIPADTPVTGNRMTFLPMTMPFMHQTVDIVSLKLEVNEKKYLAESLNNPDTVADFMRDHLKNWDREAVCVLCLDPQLHVNSMNVASIGTVDQAMVNPREIFKSAIVSNATGIIMVHNHPSGSLTPSDADKNTTSRIASCGQILGIPLLDHIIVSRDGYYSFQVNDPERLQPSPMSDIRESVRDSGPALTISQTCAQKKTNSKGIEGWVIRFPERSILQVDGKLTDVHGWEMFVRQAEKSSQAYMLDIPWPQQDSGSHSIYEPSGKQMIRHSVSVGELSRCIRSNPEFRKNQWTRFRIRSQFVSKTKDRNGKEQFAVTCPPDTILKTDAKDTGISGFRFYPYSLRPDAQMDQVYTGSFRKDFMIPLYAPKDSPKDRTQKILVRAEDLTSALYDQYQRFRQREKRLSQQEIESEQETKKEVRKGGTSPLKDVVSGIVNAGPDAGHQKEQNSLRSLANLVFQKAESAEQQSPGNNPYLQMIRQSGLSEEYSAFKSKDHSRPTESEIEI